MFVVSRLAKSAFAIVAAFGLYFSIFQSQTRAQQPLPPPVAQQLPQGQPSSGNLPPPDPQPQGQPAGQPAITGGVPGAVTSAVPGTSRFAFVIGNDGYQNAPLPTAANDASLVADALKNAGFEITGARNLDQDKFRALYRGFLRKVSAAGENAIATVYISGYGIQFEGENYLIPIGAQVNKLTDLSLGAIRLSDLTRPLSGLSGRVKIVVFDLAYDSALGKLGESLAPGLALMQPEDGSLVAINAAPGAFATPGKPPYGVYAKALGGAISAGGLDINAVFEQVRLKVSQETRGAQVPWHASKITTPFVFIERAANAPAPLVSPGQINRMRTGSLADMDSDDAFAAVLARDTFKDYRAFLRAHPRSKFAKQVRRIVAARREALTWQQARKTNTRRAYWSYLRRYPKGPHARDARRRLRRLSANTRPPLRFRSFDFNVPPPPRSERGFYDRGRRGGIAPSDRGFRSGFVPETIYEPPPPPRFRPNDRFLPPVTIPRPRRTWLNCIVGYRRSGRPIWNRMLVQRCPRVAAPQPFNPGFRPGVRPGGRPGVRPGGRPGVRSGGRPGVRPGGRPGVRPGGRPGTRPGGRPGVRPGGRPGVRPVPVSPRQQQIRQQRQRQQQLIRQRQQQQQRQRQQRIQRQRQIQQQRQRQSQQQIQKQRQLQQQRQRQLQIQKQRQIQQQRQRQQQIQRQRQIQQQRQRQQQIQRQRQIQQQRQRQQQIQKQRQLRQQRQRQQQIQKQRQLQQQRQRQQQIQRQRQLQQQRQRQQQIQKQRQLQQQRQRQQQIQKQRQLQQQRQRQQQIQKQRRLQQQRQRQQQQRRP